MATTAKLVLLSCGSFNPPTNMHFRMFELAKDYLRKQNFEVVEGIISPVNDHYPTSKYLAPSKHRCEMVQRALTPLHGQSHWVRLDRWESNQPKWVRTLEVLQHHYQELNQCSSHKPVSVKLLCGADMFETFNVPNLWKDEDIEKIVRDFGLVVITRHGSDPWATLKSSSKSKILTKYENNIFIVPEPVNNGISSTIIRESLGRNESVRYLLHDAVIEYIHQHRLYSTMASTNSNS